MNDDLQSVIDALRRAYADGVPTEDYLPLLRLLIEDMSERGLGEAMEEAFGIDRYVAQNDSARVLSDVAPPAGDVSRVERRLRTVGWEPQWSDTGYWRGRSDDGPGDIPEH